MKPYIAPHMIAGAVRDEGAVYDRLREGSPKSGARHVWANAAPQHRAFVASRSSPSSRSRPFGLQSAFALGSRIAPALMALKVNLPNWQDDHPATFARIAVALCVFAALYFGWEFTR